MGTALIILLVYVAVFGLIIYPMMKKAGPQNDVEQLENDNEQLNYLYNRKR